MLRRLLIAGGMVAGILVALLVGASWWLNGYLKTPLVIPEGGYHLEVPPGTHWGAVARQLHADGVVSAPSVLTTYGKWTGQAGRIQAGEYQLAPGLTPLSLLQELVAGRVLLHKWTLVEGWTVRDVLRALRSDDAIVRTLTTVDAIVPSLEQAHALARELKLPWPSAEGAFLPETYRFPRGTTDRDLLLRAHAALLEQLDRAWAGRRPDLPLAKPYELVILASIIERETGLPRERPIIAGVFIRRLEKGMLLQTDPTVIYGLGERFDGNLTRRDLQTDAAWNTYTRPGLPPTPIAAPGVEALMAAANPADGTALFFVATGAGDGSHRFSTTLREHQAAVRDYLATLDRPRD